MYSQIQKLPHCYELIRIKQIYNKLTSPAVRRHCAKTQTSCILLLQIGFDAGDNVHYYSLPSSGSASVINVTNESNVGYPGKFIFQIGIAGDNSTEIEVPGKLLFITVE